jgi:peroxiredoxin
LKKKDERNVNNSAMMISDAIKRGRVHGLKVGEHFLALCFFVGICVSFLACASTIEAGPAQSVAEDKTIAEKTAPQQVAEEAAEVDLPYEEVDQFTPLIDDIEMLHVGDAAPMFEVSDIYGNKFNLGDRIGKRVIALVFWSVYCDPCRNSMPSYNEILNRYKDKGLDFLAINMDGEEMSGAIRGFIADEGIKLTILLDEPEGEFLKIADPYGVQGTPTIYIIDRKGKIAFGKAGTLSLENLSSLVKSELAKN